MLILKIRIPPCPPSKFKLQKGPLFKSLFIKSMQNRSVSVSTFGLSKLGLATWGWCGDSDAEFE